MTSTIDGKQVTKTVEIDSTTTTLIKDLIAGKPPSSTKNEQDTLYDKKGRLDAVLLADHFFGAVIKKFYYNDSNQLIRIVGFDEKGNVAPFHEYLAIREIDYDEKGRVIEKRALDENRQYVKPSAYPPVMQIKYDDQGNEKEVIYLNSDRELHEGFTRTEYIYDESNTLIEKINYNGQGEIIERKTVPNN
ncbi:MAG: hypothetical protein U5L96_16280 [Owenweeksia sp.]|nr:hypothetical protein [Owenweeksia sp.]